MRKFWNRTMTQGDAIMMVVGLWLGWALVEILKAAL